jgi:hypothetical protein
MFISCMEVCNISGLKCEVLISINIDAIIYVRDDPQTGHSIIKLADGQTVETSENIIEIMSKIEVEKCRELKRTKE